MIPRASVVSGAVLLAMLCPAAQAAGVSADQVEAGAKFARLVCGACHVVNPRDRSEIPILQPPAPSFAALARRPSLTEAHLREFLGSNHRTIGPVQAMPNPRLADYQIDEIVAYVLSMRSAKQADPKTN